ncbi:MAG: hypothetical protein Q8S54_04210 [Bacteroidota bacterium]|nr:hypothetical protein [Odoribacter sp.]MDP3642378.1 hypothetical protein [Bacteroidota bacterium]
MNSISPRSYNCKDEELPVVCGFAVLSLERDLTDFTAYSPVFNAAYVTAYKGKIEIVQELVQPKSETIELKIITERIYNTLDALISPINYLEGYLNLAGTAIPVSPGDFGLLKLRKSARARDVENVLTMLHAVEANIEKYKTELMDKGLTAVLIEKFNDAESSLSAYKNQKYTLVSNRSALVQNNLGLLNDLYDQLTEICNIGKVLYKQTDKAKLNDYTFSYLMKQVRRNGKAEEVKPSEPSPAG